MVVDERSAAFMALGYASISGEPVALACTSGTAVLNYAPAIAEAYYRHLPLIAVSADRPEAWIDQDDSQTLPQPGILAPIVKRSYDLPDIPADDSGNIWWANRTINDALLTATSDPQGPVHINLQFDNPLNVTSPQERSCGGEKRIIEMIAPAPQLSTAAMRELGATIASPCKVMIVCGFMPPDHRLNRALARLASKPNVTVLCESMSNLHAPELHYNIDSLLSVMTDSEREAMRPDVVITLGGALLSRRIKEYLRAYPPRRHWHVGFTRTTVDCLKSLTTRIAIAPNRFFPALASALLPHSAPSGYAGMWNRIEADARASHERYVGASGWSALKAFTLLVPEIPAEANVQLSNGTCARYYQLCDYRTVHRCDCNRGVSGIDGSTSTAIGASMAYSGPTWLITGDMSALYDIGALASPHITPRLKTIVSANGGGGIFRFIPSTRTLPELDRCLAMDIRLPLRELAEAWGFALFEARDEQELRQALPAFVAEHERPAILEIVTDGAADATILQEYFNRNKK